MTPAARMLSAIPNGGRPRKTYGWRKRVTKIKTRPLGATTERPQVILPSAVTCETCCCVALISAAAADASAGVGAVSEFPSLSNNSISVPASFSDLFTYCSNTCGPSLSYTCTADSAYRFSASPSAPRLRSGLGSCAKENQSIRFNAPIMAAAASQKQKNIFRKRLRYFTAAPLEGDKRNHFPGWP